MLAGFLAGAPGAEAGLAALGEPLVLGAGASAHEHPVRPASGVFLNFGSGVRPPTPADPWDPAVALPWALSTYSFKRSLETNSRNRSTLRSLSDSYQTRGLSAAQAEELSRVAAASLTQGPGMPWPAAERLATGAMHVGDPRIARKTWERSLDAPSEALRLARIGDASLASFDFQGARSAYLRALELDPALGEAWYGKALLHVLEGKADEALRASQTARILRLSEAQANGLRTIEEVASQAVPEGGIGETPVKAP